MWRRRKEATQAATAEGVAAVTRDAGRSALLDAALRLSETQLQLQIADEASLDGRTMGLLAFNGALVAADIAAKSFLDTYWWTILPAAGVSAVLCLLSALARTSDVGIEAYLFYTKFGAGPSLDTREALLADLNIAFHKNAKRVRAKTWSLRIALVSLAVGLAVAAFLISGELSNRIKDMSGAATTPRPTIKPAPVPPPQPTGLPHIGPAGSIQ